MRLFMQSLKSSPITPVNPDGGECIYLTPDASGGDVGHGFTCTGLFFKEFNGNNPIFWVGNDGRNVEPPTGSTDQDASIVLIECDYAAEGDTVPANVYATKLLEIFTYPISDTSVQGVIEANDGTLWFVGATNIINIQSYGDGSNNAIEISRFEVVGANGLAYDDVNNELLVKVNSNLNIARYSTSGVLLDANALIVNSTAIDQIYYDSAIDIFYGGLGSNGSAGSVRSWNLTTGIQGETLGGYPNVLASEGISFVNHSDGNRYLYYASDAYYHQTNIPDANYRLNAIHKLRIN